MFRKRILFPIVMDCFLIHLSVLTSYFFRFGQNMPQEYLDAYFGMALVVIVTKIVVFNIMGLYKPMWKYAGIDEIINLFFMVCLANGLIIVGIYFTQYTKVPRSIYLIATFVDFVYLGVSRFSKQIYGRLVMSETNIIQKKMKRVMVIGAGEAGGILIQELKNNPVRKLLPVCIIDDDKDKKNRKINGVTVVGGREVIPHCAVTKKIDQIIIAIPSISKVQLAGILEQCKKTSCELKILPFINQVRDISGDVEKVLMQRMRDVDIEDLLGRDEVELDNALIERYIFEKTVLVTGGGGSIGSELCRQIAALSPERLIILDFYEENAYNIQNQLKMSFPNLNIKVCIANIRERERIQQVFQKYKPDVVFHAAAHKHVPLMEDNPCEAVKNNILGTKNVVDAATDTGVKRFVLISTDKAVNPTNVMGATKRFCEMIVQTVGKNSDTEFVAVRFGNVLGSSGSVVPVFKKQILAGGPVTVMHPEIIRYFMTIPEAAGLVIQACAIAKGGEIFVLDMGQPVKIDKLARDLIKLSGFEPDKDIDIVYTGLRPGEKLYEELLMDEEGISSTNYEKIYVAKPLNMDIDKINADLRLLEKSIEQGDDAVVDALHHVVATYKKNA